MTPRQFLELIQDDVDCEMVSVASDLVVITMLDYGDLDLLLEVCRSCNLRTNQFQDVTGQIKVVVHLATS